MFAEDRSVPASGGPGDRLAGLSIRKTVGAYGAGMILSRQSAGTIGIITEVSTWDAIVVIVGEDRNCKEWAVTT